MGKIRDHLTQFLSLTHLIRMICNVDIEKGVIEKSQVSFH